MFRSPLVEYPPEGWSEPGNLVLASRPTSTVYIDPSRGRATRAVQGAGGGMPRIRAAQEPRIGPVLRCAALWAVALFYDSLFA